MNLRRLFKRSQEDSELSEELESHLAHEIDDNLARGMSPEEARRQAYVRLAIRFAFARESGQPTASRGWKIPGAICALRRAR